MTKAKPHPAPSPTDDPAPPPTPAPKVNPDDWMAKVGPAKRRLIRRTVTP